MSSGRGRCGRRRFGHFSVTVTGGMAYSQDWGVRPRVARLDVDA